MDRSTRRVFYSYYCNNCGVIYWGDSKGLIYFKEYVFKNIIIEHDIRYKLGKYYRVYGIEIPYFPIGITRERFFNKIQKYILLS